MREIKLRAYHKKWKKMLLVKSISWIHGGGVHLGDFGSKEVYQLEPMKDVVLMQYTGLKDKNGEEIYEGDLVLVKPNMVGSSIGEIRWSEEYFEFLFDNGTNWGLNDIPPTNKHTIEIIGNIHENPGLLDK